MDKNKEFKNRFKLCMSMFSETSSVVLEPFCSGKQRVLKQRRRSRSYACSLVCCEGFILTSGYLNV